MRIGILAAIAAAAALAGAAFAQDRGREKTMEAKLIEVGAEAPDFRLNDQGGAGVRLSDLRGKKWVALAFFPKAMTGG